MQGKYYRTKEDSDRALKFMKLFHEALDGRGHLTLCRDMGWWIIVGKGGHIRNGREGDWEIHTTGTARVRNEFAQFSDLVEVSPNVCYWRIQEPPKNKWYAEQIVRALRLKG